VSQENKETKALETCPAAVGTIEAPLVHVHVWHQSDTKLLLTVDSYSRKKTQPECEVGWLCITCKQTEQTQTTKQTNTNKQDKQQTQTKNKKKTINQNKQTESQKTDKQNKTNQRRSDCLIWPVWSISGHTHTHTHIRQSGHSDDAPKQTEQHKHAH